MDIGVGSKSDPRDCMGLAHFCEHMLFLGTGKYPEEACYSQFLADHGGSSNAYTTYENTNYYFEVLASSLEGALDIFAQFFIEPLFTEGSTERELNAIQSEHDKNVQSDIWRRFQMLKNETEEGSTFCKFSTGNNETLIEEPKKSGVDIRDRLKQFHKAFYYAENMTLAVLGKEGLEELEQMVTSIFSGVPSLYEGEIEERKEAQSAFGEDVVGWDRIPFNEALLGQTLRYIPIANTHTLECFFPMPPTNEHYLAKPESLV